MDEQVISMAIVEALPAFMKLTEAISDVSKVAAGLKFVSLENMGFNGRITLDIGKFSYPPMKMPQGVDLGAIRAMQLLRR